MTAAEIATAAPVWNIWTVLGTAGAGAAVALLVDFFLKPRLQVRNENFSQRAKDRLEIVKVVRAIMIETRKGMTADSLRGVPADALEELQELVDRHNAEHLAKLDELSEDLATAYAVGGHHLATPVLRLVEHAGGLLQGLRLANVDMETMRRRVAPCFNLLYDVLMTSRLQTFAYRRRVQWVRRTVETGDSKRQIAVLRLYGLQHWGNDSGCAVIARSSL